MYYIVYKIIYINVYINIYKYYSTLKGNFAVFGKIDETWGHDANKINQ